MSHAIALVNLTDGTVAGHKAGCSDLKRGKHGTKFHADEPWEFEVDTKADAWYSYNSDFIAEGGPGNAYDIDWAPCTKRVPEGSREDVLANLGTDEAEEAPVEDMSVDDLADAVEETETTQEEQDDLEGYAPVNATVGRKWTYLYAADGSLIAELRNDQLAAIAAWTAGRK
jgi:hypothetical protein